MARRIRRLLGVGLFVQLAGCSTMATVAGGIDPDRFDCNPEYEIPRVYSGVVNDLRFFAEGSEGNVTALFDLPLSFVADTLILPYTLFTQWRHGHLCPGDSLEGRRSEMPLKDARAPRVDCPVRGAPVS